MNKDGVWLIEKNGVCLIMTPAGTRFNGWDIWIEHHGYGVEIQDKSIQDLIDLLEEVKKDLANIV